MRLTSDFHTHTNYTHGVGTVEENVVQAEIVGLDAIAITDHAYNSKYAIKHGDLEKMRADIDKIRDKYSPKILLGIEANLIGSNGEIDVDDEELATLDLVNLGFHKLSKTSFKEFFKFVLPNLMCSIFKFKPTKKQIERNTNAYLCAMDKHRISTLAHLNYGGCKVDVVKIANECVKKGIYIELNGKRINFSKQEIDDMVATKVKFIVNSDAHSPYDVGRNSRGFNFIEKYNIPLDQVVNIVGKLPKFK